MTSDGKEQSYEDLKAKLGLKSPSSAQSSNPDLTPAGGFDLGLEKSAVQVDSSEELERQADERAASVGGPDLVVRESTGTRSARVGMVLVAIVIALGLGFATKGVLYDRDIETRQTRDAQAILDGIKSVKAVGTEVKLMTAVDTYIDTVLVMTKKLDTARQAKKLTDALINKVRGDAKALIVESRQFIAMGPSLDPKNMLKDAVFNGTAIKEFLKLSKALDTVYQSSLAIAQEEGLLAEFLEQYDPKRVVSDSYSRAWRWAQWKDKEGRSRGHLVGVEIQKDDKGNVIFNKQEVKPPPGYKVKKGESSYVWQIKVKYDNPKIVGGEAIQFADSDVIVEWDLKQDLTKVMRKTLGQHHEGYRINLIKRILGRVQALKTAVETFPKVRTKVFKKLDELAGNN
ncbi:MAG TPA: hypothetical protein EYN06_02355 [Myxococcales bacterium]|nr:hypothetical protein [Myxococcales bacterium]HIN85294.1 hypothetical protein [Myxococcales bacterium]